MLYLLYWRKSSNRQIDQKKNKVIPALEQPHLQLHRSQSVEQTIKKDFRRKMNRLGTQTAETVNESSNKIQQSTLKTTSQMFSSKYQIIKVSSNLVTLDISQQQEQFKSIPSMQELPETVRTQDTNLLTIKESEEQRTEFLNSRIIFKLINRLIVLQGFLGFLLFNNLHFALASLLSLITIWIIRFSQTANVYIDVLQLILFISFDFTSLFLFNPNEIWTYTYLVLLAIEVILEFIILNTQKQKNFENLQASAQQYS
ncbi:unnamed protein product [Paramecium pentaurelia]|uniref:Transmembrane protein n=1 Tax=Paramecium pentaurelia TaxID=43138 RepID=A0A8S1V995_9CILI|nr:unnamed protein product [Paramecium pentaurelia]